MKNKILFISPPQSCRVTEKYNNLKFPLGFLYMGNQLEKEGFNVKILDCPVYYKKRKKVNEKTTKIGLFPHEIKQIIKEFRPDIIGISCAYTAYESDAFEVIDIVRQTEQETKKKYLLVVGGAHSSANPKYVLRNKKIDMVAIGEGEETIVEIAEKYRDGKKLTKILGTALWDNGKIKINGVRPYIQNLDNNSPAWHLLNMNLYFQHPDNSAVTMRGPSVDIITSRGCPMKCVFCSIHTVWGRKWRPVSARKVVDDMEFLYKKYQVRQFRIQDDNLTVDKKRVYEICDEIMKRKLNIKWDTPNGVAFWTLNKKVLKKMKQAGLYRITFGIESGSKESQRYVRKIVNLKRMRKIVAFCHKINLWVCSTFIIGFPYEKEKNIRETEDFINHSGINFPFVYVAQSYQGTEMYGHFMKDGLLKDFKKTSNIGLTQYDTKYFTSEQLNKRRDKIIKQFYLKKILAYLGIITFYKEFLSKVRTIEDVKYVFKNLSTLLFS